MFHATYIGHHGWLFEGETGRVLVDPIFTERFGFSDATELRAYPPRTLDLAKLPAVDAVFLTHEHEGHFEIASLNLLDRKTPIFISPHSSVAMRNALAEMGFRVRFVRASEPLRFGDLELLPLATDQLRGAIEEWDVIAYMIRDERGDGSFVSSVDMPPTAAMRERLQRVMPRVGLWAYTTNHHQYPFQTDFLPEDLGGLRSYVSTVSSMHDALAKSWAPPAASLVVGGGWCFGGSIAWLNRNAFTFENEEARQMLARLFPREPFLAPLPGHRISMRDNDIASITESDFISRPAASEWPSRAHVGDVSWLERYRPACGRTELRDDELDQLTSELKMFASHLYGSKLFRELLSLSSDETAGKKATFALSLRDGEDGGAYVFEYDSTRCDFVSVDCADPVATYVAVYESWATDLLATFHVQMSQNAIAFGRSREWIAIPGKLTTGIAYALFNYVHPLRFPERFARLYDRVIANQARARMSASALSSANDQNAALRFAVVDP